MNMLWTPRQKRIARPTPTECNGLGLGLGFGGGGGPVSGVIDPASLALSGWYRDYTAALPWAGKASAGTSGTPTLQTGGFGAPGAGATSNGRTSAAFPADKYIRDAVGLVGAYITPTAWRAIIVARFDAPAAAGANPYNDAAFLQDGSNGVWGVAINSTNIFAYAYVGGTPKVAAVAYPGTGWHMIDASYDGATLSCSVDGGTPGTIASATPNDCTADTLIVGASYNGATKYNGDIAEIITAKTTLSGTSTADFKAYVNNYYGLAL